VNVLILRPSYFMENILNQIGIIKQMGMMGSALKGDLKIPMVAAKDVAAVAAKHLLNMNFKGQTVEYILGQRDVSYNEIATHLGKAIGKPDLKYVQFSYADAKKSMVQSGAISENVADFLNAMSEGLNNGKINSNHKPSSNNSSPTKLEEFAEDFAKTFGGSVLA